MPVIPSKGTPGVGWIFPHPCAGTSPRRARCPKQSPLLEELPGRSCVQSRGLPSWPGGNLSDPISHDQTGGLTTHAPTPACRPGRLIVRSRQESIPHYQECTPVKPLDKTIQSICIDVGYDVGISSDAIAFCAAQSAIRAKYFLNCLSYSIFLSPWRIARSSTTSRKKLYSAL